MNQIYQILKEYNFKFVYLGLKNIKKIVHIMRNNQEKLRLWMIGERELETGRKCYQCQVRDIEDRKFININK